MALGSLNCGMQVTLLNVFDSPTVADHFPAPLLINASWVSA